MHNGKLKMYT
uniref:Uncharacterized protein n=1 Tax=Anguilla anguilla TaxID=7936 RepID=A0A0E9QCK4_ANGAN